jgi:hypothetical protein
MDCLFELDSHGVHMSVISTLNPKAHSLVSHVHLRLTVSPYVILTLNPKTHGVCMSY